jgi:type IV pilus assembly protein PilW
MNTTSFITSRDQRGLSLVELMVGIAVGMFIVAAAAVMVSTQLVDNRRLLLETQVQQDLRAAADIIIRDLRRAGASSLQNAHSAVASPVSAGDDNPWMALPLTEEDVTASSVDYRYERTLAENGPFKFQLSGGAIKSRLGGAYQDQDLTDPTTLTITEFSIRPIDEPALAMSCQRTCPPPGGPQACWPQLLVRRFNITITGRAVSDESIVRTVNASVRLRNDDIQFLGPTLCP